LEGVIQRALCSAPSLEEHFEDILAVLLLGCGLALASGGKSSGEAA